MKVLSKFMYGGKNTYKKGGYVPQTQMSDEELSEKAYGKSKGPQRFTRKDVKPQTQMTSEELSKLASGTKQSEISTKTKTKDNNNKNNNQKDDKKDDKKGSKIYNLKHDRKWEYKVTDGKWFARKKGTEKWYDISNSKESVDKLDGEHPNARGQNMKHGGTLMSRYAKAYEEGGTPDGLANSLSRYNERYGIKLPTHRKRNYEDKGNLNNIVDFLKHMKEHNPKEYGNIDIRDVERKIKAAKTKWLRDAWAKENDGNYWTETQEKNKDEYLKDMPSSYLNNIAMDYLQQTGNSRQSRDFYRFKKNTVALTKKLLTQNESGADMSQYDTYLNNPESFAGYHYSGLGAKIRDVQREIKEKEQKASDRGTIYEMTPEERYIMGKWMQDEDTGEIGGGFADESKLIDSISRKYNINITPETRSYLTDDYTNQESSEKKKDPTDTSSDATETGGGEIPTESEQEGTETKPTTFEDRAKKIPTHLDRVEFEGKMLFPHEIEAIKKEREQNQTQTQTEEGTTEEGTTEEGTTEEGTTQTDTEQKPPVQETRKQRRERRRKEWYESQATPASVQEQTGPEQETEDPSDSNVTTDEGGGGTPPPDTDGETTTDTGGGTPPAEDDFSGPNPHPRRSEEWFEWNKRKRAAMHAKHGAITKKINYLKGGMYGKGTFRR